MLQESAIVNRILFGRNLSEVIRLAVDNID